MLFVVKLWLHGGRRSPVVIWLCLCFSSICFGEISRASLSVNGFSRMYNIRFTCIPSSNLLMHQKLSASIVSKVSCERPLTSWFSRSPSSRKIKQKEDIETESFPGGVGKIFKRTVRGHLGEDTATDFLCYP